MVARQETALDLMLYLDLSQPDFDFSPAEAILNALDISYSTFPALPIGYSQLSCSTQHCIFHASCKLPVPTVFILSQRKNPSLNRASVS